MIQLLESLLEGVCMNVCMGVCVRVCMRGCNRNVMLFKVIVFFVNERRERVIRLFQIPAYFGMLMYNYCGLLPFKSSHKLQGYKGLLC